MLYRFGLAGVKEAWVRAAAEEAVAAIDGVHSVKAWESLMLVDADLPRTHIVRAVNSKLEPLNITAVLRDGVD